MLEYFEKIVDVDNAVYTHEPSWSRFVFAPILVGTTARPTVDPARCTPDAGGPGSEVFLCGDLRDLFVKAQVSDQFLELCIFFLECLEFFGLILSQAAVFLTPGVVRRPRDANAFADHIDGLALTELYLPNDARDDHSDWTGFIGGKVMPVVKVAPADRHTRRRPSPLVRDRGR